jgi:hypothetical protein
MQNELGRMRKVAVVISFQVLSQQWPVRTYKNRQLVTTPTSCSVGLEFKSRPAIGYPDGFFS